ncbi:MAG TPA: rhodanese-like domain-containing protein [Nitrospirota bacterium]|nr:rhodanese-like domain-containing protein [Nitrospirota bacterium]
MDSTVKAIMAKGLMILLIAQGFAVLFSIAGCATGMTRDELFRQMQDGTAPLIVDVRSQGEYDQDHVPGAVHIPFYAVGTALQERGFPKKDPVLLYCEHGPRAGMSAFMLRLSGYEAVYSLEGHMKGWRKNDFPREMSALRGSAMPPSDQRR